MNYSAFHSFDSAPSRFAVGPGCPCCFSDSEQIFFSSFQSPHSLSQTVSKANYIQHILFSEKTDGLINAYGFRVENVENFREKNNGHDFHLFYLRKKQHSYKSSQLTVEWELFPRERVRS